MNVHRWAIARGPILFPMGLVGRGTDGRELSSPLEQARRVVERLDEILREHELSRGSVLHMTFFLTDVSLWREVMMPVLDEQFAGQLPPCTVVGVTELIEPWMKIELTAVVSVGTVSWPA